MAEDAFRRNGACSDREALVAKRFPAMQLACCTVPPDASSPAFPEGSLLY